MVEVDRALRSVAVELLGGFRALVVNGPRQAGKSTLVRQLQRDRGPVANLDDASLRDVAVNDPVGFLAQLPDGSAIDEFQRGGDPLLARAQGRSRPGRFAGTVRPRRVDAVPRHRREVDVVLERGRDVVGVEVKASATPTIAQAKHLAFLRDRLGDRFRCGIVLHTGDQRLVLGDRLVAAPISSLWA